MASHNELGRQGEQLALQFLIGKGYEILDKNWTHAKFEVDIIAYMNGVIVFAEVKTRSSISFGMPEDFVDEAKQKQLQKAAQAYIEIMEHEGEIRFDIIAVLAKKDDNFEITHLEDAFWPYE